MAKVKVLKAFDAYVDGEKKHFPLGGANIPMKLIQDCNMVANDLISLDEKEEPKPE